VVLPEPSLALGFTWLLLSIDLLPAVLGDPGGQAGAESLEGAPQPPGALVELALHRQPREQVGPVAPDLGQPGGLRVLLRASYTMFTFVWTLWYPPLPVSGYKRAPCGESVCAPAEHLPGACEAAAVSTVGTRPRPATVTAPTASAIGRRNLAMRVFFAGSDIRSFLQCSPPSGQRPFPIRIGIHRFKCPAGDRNHACSQQKNFRSS
jgi:hypothetical protein